MIDNAVNMSRTPPEMRRASPDAGEHTEEVLREGRLLGGEIEDFRARRVV